MQSGFSRPISRLGSYKTLDLTNEEANKSPRMFKAILMFIIILYSVEAWLIYFAKRANFWRALFLF